MSDDPQKKASDAKPKTENGAQGKQVLLQKIYLRDASVEVPDGPMIFTGEWKPAMDVDLNTRINEVGEQTHQVRVTVTVTAKLTDKTAYIVEVDQAGVFRVAGFDNDADLQQILGAYCPAMLFPYVRETISDLIQRAGFPQFLLQPVNFDALYQQHLAKENAPAEAKH